MHTAALVAWTWLGLATAGPIPQETPGKFTIYRRDSTNDIIPRDDPNFFPFPANKSSIVSADTQPPDAPPQDLTVNASLTTASGEIPRHFIEQKCDAGKKYKITKAWDEANLLAKAQTNFKFGYQYDIPHTQWLGPDWNSESSWIPWRYNYQKLISDNFGRLSRVFSNDAQSHEYIYWYCFDYSRQCTEGVQAYSWDSNGWFWSNHYTVFCDPFYDRMTMEDQINEYADNQHEQKVMENFQLSRGQIMFHEVWHYKNLVSSPRTGDHAYQAQPVWDLAKNKGTSWAYVNADSYTLDAVAIYVQQYYKSSMSPVPFKELAKLDPAAAAAVAPPAPDNATAKTFTDQPPGWVAPQSSDGSPDLSVWEELHLGDAPASTQAPSTQATTTTTQAPPPQAPPSQAPPSQAPPSQAPPSQAPPSQTSSTAGPPPPQESCNTQYKVFFDSFDIKGNFDAGDKGATLEQQIKGCGKVSKWKFNTLTNQQWKWEASGELPIWTQDCVQRAIHTAGGDDNEHCSGHG